MSLKSVKNNIFLYSLSLSNNINYIYYFPFIILYLLNNDNLSKLNYIQIYIFFVIYDLTRNLSSNLIRKISNFVGINKLISINLIILLLISFVLFLAAFRSFHVKAGLNTLIILRIITSLANITPIFTSKIIVNIFGNKAMYNKLNFVDIYEKFNFFLIFVFIYFITPSKFPFYFLFSFVYNLYFLIIYLIFFKCQDEKNFIFYEEKNEKIKSSNNQSTDITKKLPKKKFGKRIKGREPTSMAEDNNYSKSGDKGRFGKRKSSAKMINNEKILEKESNENYLSEKNNENGDIENNMIVLTTTNNNQQITNKDYTNNDNNSQFQKQNIYMVNNIPIVSSSQRVFQEKMTNNSSIIDLKNDTLNSKKKNIFIYLNLIPNRFLIFLFLFMLYSKTISLKNIFSVETHLLFYIGYFFIIIPIDALTNIIYAKTMKNKNSGKKILLITSCVLSIISIICYIYLFLNSFNHIKNKRIQFILYVLFFVLNLFLKEGLIIMMRIFYKNSMNIGFSRETLKKNKEISNIFACLLFLGYNISLLFINNPNSIFDKIVYFIMYYFLPIFFLLIIFIINAYIS
jgi:hypothetical protein